MSCSFRAIRARSAAAAWLGLVLERLVTFGQHYGLPAAADEQAGQPEGQDRDDGQARAGAQDHDRADAQAGRRAVQAGVGA